MRVSGAKAGVEVAPHGTNPGSQRVVSCARNRHGYYSYALSMLALISEVKGYPQKVL